jgi:hypothetical protein
MASPALLGAPALGPARALSVRPIPSRDIAIIERKFEWWFKRLA